jgi:hypothetical protein
MNAPILQDIETHSTLHVARVASLLLESAQRKLVFPLGSLCSADAVIAELASITTDSRAGGWIVELFAKLVEIVLERRTSFELAKSSVGPLRVSLHQHNSRVHRMHVASRLCEKMAQQSEEFCSLLVQLVLDFDSAPEQVHHIDHTLAYTLNAFAELHRARVSSTL